MIAPRVSIITPAYNAAAHLAATAQSVLAQTVREWEWIVVDDGSTDATREIIATFADPRITLIAAPHSGLPAVARNLGLARAHAPFIAFLDADDLWLPDKLAVQLASFDAHPEVGLVFSTSRYWYDEVHRLGRRAEPSIAGLPNPGLLFDQLCAQNLIATSSVMVRRTLLDAHGGFDEAHEQRGTEDYELWLRLAPHAPFVWIARPLIHYRVHPQSLSGNAVANARGRILAVEKAARRTPLPAGLRLDAAKLFWLGHAQFRDGVEHCGRRALSQSLRLAPRNKAAWIWLALGFLGRGLTRRLRRLAYRFV